MTFSRYFILAITAATLMSFSVVNPDKGKGKPNAQQKSDSTRVQPAKKNKPPVRSSWLNEKNFPWYKESGCPFYVKAKEGC